MKSEEKWLTVCSFVFGLVAVIMIAMEYILPLLLHAWTGGNTERGVMGLPMTFWLMMMAFVFFSWIASIVLIAVNLVYNRGGIKTILGRIGMVLNAICILYHTFTFCMIVRL